MNKKLLLLVAIIAVALLVPAAVMAQSPGGLAYTSGVQVVNLDAGTATIGLTFYNQDGSTAAVVPDTIAGNSSKTYFPIMAVPVGFNGSLVVSSDKPITAIANTVTTDFKYGAATTSFSAGSTSVNLPLVMCNNSGFNTWFNIQNAGSSTASVTIDYSPGSSGQSGSESDSIAVGAAHTYDQEAGSSTLNCDDLGPTFIGSATITSDQPVVATLMQLNTGGFKILMGYNGFTGASTTVSLPLIMANNSGFYTGMQIQNTGGGSTTATVDYGDNLVGAYAPPNETCTLGAGESCTLIQSGGPWTGNSYVGSATVTASEDLVVIVNQVSLGSGNKGPFGTAYEGFDPASGTDDISAPLIMSNNSGYYTGIQTQNVGGSTCAVTIDYGPNTGGAFNPTTESFSITPGQSKTIIQSGPAANNGGVNDWGTNKYIGSAEISGDGSCSLVAIINEFANLKGDNFFTYVGYNH